MMVKPNSPEHYMERADNTIAALDDSFDKAVNALHIEHAKVYALISIAKSLVLLTNQMPVASDGVLRIEEMVP